VKKYSEFINFPIYIWSSKEVTREVEVEDTDEDTHDHHEDKHVDDDGLEITDEPAKEEKKEK